jgi:GT2 family glycosyltransferase
MSQVRMAALSAAPSDTALAPVCVKGKFIFAGSQKLYVRGVTYGTFRPDENGSEFHDMDRVEADFRQIAANGMNAIRTYTVPPRWLLDAAQLHGLRVMVGLPWEQHIAFLDDKSRVRSVEERVSAGVRACAGHPAVLCYAVGNEIPAPIVRWYGHRRIEGHIKRLYQAAKDIDPSAPVTYVNYPSTEYLDLTFLDLLCFNVYLESKERMRSYMARLQNIAGDRPLIMAEIGVDSRRNGKTAQAQMLDWQIRTAFAAGCAGAFVFSWTDEWYRGGHDIDDWEFGLTDRERRPKPALTTVRDAFSDVPFPRNRRWPRFSVVVCSYNGSTTIRDCFDALKKLEYPDFEVIVVDDGSTDCTAAIAQQYGFRVTRSENRGLSSARNTGMEMATGEIIAYIDDDAYPDPHWLTYLASTFLDSRYAAVGGPNIPPPGRGAIADCVANAPGGPLHVLLSDQEAEHIPGCNLAIRKSALREIGGFDPQYRTAGDDVDVCWRLREGGYSLGFNPAAVVWHYRRNSVRAYWRQQQGYGKAEALLERKWPERYNANGHLTWGGRVYGNGLPDSLGLRRYRIYYGTWGSAPFQSVYQQSTGGISSLLLMPEWYLIIFALLVLSGLGLFWRPLLLLLPLIFLSISASVLQIGLSARRASFKNGPASQLQRFKLHTITGFLYLIQPLARLRGRLYNGLVPWRQRRPRDPSTPRSQVFAMWSERWRTLENRLTNLSQALRASGAVVLKGGDYDRWDLEVRCGMLASTRLLMTTEEHGAGKQLIRVRTWPVCSTRGIMLLLLFSALSVFAALDRSLMVSIIPGFIALLSAIRMFQECGTSKACVIHAIESLYPQSVETFDEQVTARDKSSPTIGWSVSGAQTDGAVGVVSEVSDTNDPLIFRRANAASPQAEIGRAAAD